MTSTSADVIQQIEVQEGRLVEQLNVNIGEVRKDWNSDQLDKSDSGMEESFQNSADSRDESGDEDEQIGSRKSKMKKRMILEDSDEESLAGDTQKSGNVETHYEKMQEEKESTSLVCKNTTSSHYDSDNDEDDDEDRLVLQIDEKEGSEDENATAAGDDCVLSDKLSRDFDKVLESEVCLKNTDLFDAEENDEKAPSLEEGEEFEHSGDRQDQETDDTDERYEEEMNDDDEGFDESQLDPKLLAKLKKIKGASKTPNEREKKNRKSKTNAERMMDIHSESQRLMRESRINLPYYEPEKKSLGDFLARAEKKKLEYSALRRLKDIQKAQIIHEKLSVRPPVYPSPSSHKSSSRDKDQSESIKLAVEVQEEVSLKDSGVMSQDGNNASQTSTVVLDNSQQMSKYPSITSMEEDELPDLGASSSTRQIMEEVLSRITESSSEKNTECVDSPVQKIECALNAEPEVELLQMNLTDLDTVKEHGVTEARKLLSDVPSLKRDQSRDLFRSQSTIGDDKESVTSIQASNPDECVEHQEETGENHVMGESPLADAENSCAVSKTIVQDAPLSDCTNTESKIQEDDSEQTIKNPMTPKQKLLQKLHLQGLALPELPTLSGTQDTVICLDDDEGKPKKQPEFAKLMDRLAQHTRKRVVKPAYDVDISIVEKQGQDGEIRELTLKSLKYHVGEEVPNSSQNEGTPGSKLLVLKKQLGVGMKQKRQEARQRRQQIYALENEEGYEENKEDDADEEEEAEMTEGSDTDEEEDPEEDGFELQYGNLDDSDDGTDYNPLLDTEAKDDDDEDEDDNDEAVNSNFDEDSNDVHLHFDVSDEEEEEDDEEKLEDRNDGDDESEENDKNDDRKMTVLKKKKKKAKSSNRLFSDDEENEDEERESLNSSQPWKVRARPEKSPELENITTRDSLSSVDQWVDDLTPMTRHLQDTQVVSPDLYGPSTHEESESNSGRIGESLNDSSQSMGYFNPASQLLDADGYLKMTQTQMPKSRIAMLANVEDDNTARDSFDSSLKMSVGKIFAGSSGQVVEEDDNMHELMGLCSGTFGPAHDSDEEIRPSQNGLPNTQSFKVHEASDEENLFNILSADEEEENRSDKRKHVNRILSDSEEEKDDDDDDGKDTDELDEGENEESNEKFTGFKDKNKGIRKEFLDVEAELSGSEFDSDENLDLAEEDDILEEEEGDRDMAGVSNEVLRDQVGRVHMKQLQDQDDREVMRFKEMYLQDGDLYSEGGGRMRNFRWKNIDESSQQDVFAGHSDEEQEEEEDAEEIRWRKERYEREKFLLESQNEDKASDNELLKFGQLFVKRKDSVSDEITQPSAPVRPIVSAPFVEPHKPSIKKKGSFLSRSKDALNKLAQAAKSALGNSSTRNSRNFVFQSVSAQEDPEGNVVTPQVQPLQPPKRKAHSVDAGQQAAKKQKTASDTPVRPVVRRQSSIFNLLEK